MSRYVRVWEAGQLEPDDLVVKLADTKKFKRPRKRSSWVESWPVDERLPIITVEPTELINPAA